MVKKTTYIAPVTTYGGPKTFTPSTAQILGKPANPCAPPGSPPGTHKFPSTFPIHVTATTTLQSNSAGGVNAISLKNPMGQPMEILEIKFQLFNSATSIGNLGGIIACNLELGKFAITNGFVPIWCMGRSENLAAESVSDINTVPGCANEFTWRLAHPLYVSPDSVLVPTFQHRGQIQNDISIRISYSARSIPPGAPPPRKLFLPYAASYTSKSFGANAAGVDQSLETDLVNPFDTELYLQRFTGRVSALNLSLTPPAIIEAMVAEGVMNYVCPESMAALQFNVRMVDSFGRPLVRELVPFRMVFSGVTRSWETDGAVMDPRSFIIAYLRKDAPFQGSTSANILAQASIGVVGFRSMVGGPS